ncbi:WG repeat-containing protein [Marinirhabdus gelatinilytica]|nr:WG repeat-containing protein [Marinirhabdus gelatinilytica]
MFSQSPQIFHEPFRTSSDIYGYTTTKTKPTGFGTLAIEQLATIIEGVNGYSGSDLQEFGITFPMRCTNCYYYVSGEVSMKIPDNDFRSRANFSQGGSVNLNSGLNRSISWNDLTIKRHNEALTKYRQGNYWENTGRVESIKISEVKGADFGLITRAIEKFEKKKLNRSKYLYHLKKANYSGNPSYQERLSFAMEARTFAQSVSEISEIESLITKLKGKLNSEKEQKTSTEISPNNGTTKETFKIESNSDEDNKRYENSGKQQFYDSYAKGMRQAQDMRDEANAIVPRYRFELEYKKDMLKRANELEKRLVKPATFVLTGSDENANVPSYTNLNSNSGTKTNNKTAAVLNYAANALSTIGSQIEKSRIENERIRKSNVASEKRRHNQAIKRLNYHVNKMAEIFEKYNTSLMGYDEFKNGLRMYENGIKEYEEFKILYYENKKISTKPVRQKLRDYENYSFLKELGKITNKNEANKFIYNNPKNFEILSEQSKKDVINYLKDSLKGFNQDYLTQLGKVQSNDALFIALLNAGMEANKKAFINKIKNSKKIQNYLYNYYKGPRVILVDKSITDAALALDIKTFKYGYWDIKNNSWRIPAKYLTAKPFINNEAVVAEVKEGLDYQYKTISLDGKISGNAGDDILILGEFSEGFAVAIKKNGRLKGYVDQSFNWVIKPKYVKAGKVKFGKATIKTLSGKEKVIKVKTH